MADERQVRKHPSSILRVSFEHPASGERALVAAWDASLGGMFLETIAPLEVGALIVLELQTPHAKVSADARVLWTRATSGGADRPPGMAVSLIDLPEDVSAALVRALLTGLPEERTILGVGGASKDVTHPGGIRVAPPRPAAGAPPPPQAPAPAPPAAGKPPPPAPPKPTPRETQIGVAPPANQPKSKPAVPVPVVPVPVPVAPSKELDASILAKEIMKAPEPEPEPEPAQPKPKPKLVLEPSDPGLEAIAPAPPLAAAEEKPRARPQAAAASDPSRDSLEPIPKSGIGGRLLLLLVLGGGGAAAYVYREPLAQMLLPPPATTPTTTTTTPPAESLSAAPPRVDDVVDATPDVEIASAAATTDAAARDAGTHDAAAHDAGARDAGARDAGTRDAGRADAGKAAKPDAGHHKP